MNRLTSGALLFLAGMVVFMGIITAEIFYPPGYSTAHNEVSDLGATRPPDSVIYQPSATIFNAIMIVGGVLVILAAVGLQRVFSRLVVTGAVALLGIGMLGVGVFPGNVEGLHPLFALIAFVGAGAAALASASVARPPFRYFAILLGAIIYVFLLLAFFFASSVFPVLGDGGTERWIVYPAVLWILGFGGYLMGRNDT